MLSLKTFRNCFRFEAQLNTRVTQKIIKCNKLIGPIKRLSINLPLLTICKSFIRPHPGYGSILYDNLNTEHFQNKLGKVRYSACHAITGAIKGISWLYSRKTF